MWRSFLLFLEGSQTSSPSVYSELVRNACFGMRFCVVTSDQGIPRVGCFKGPEEEWLSSLAASQTPLRPPIKGRFLAPTPQYCVRLSRGAWALGL